MMKQLLYGSADGISGRSHGGWGVFRETEGLDETSRDQLAAMASVVLRQTMPQFPAEQDLLRRVKRFRARRRDDCIQMAMSVEAGMDHTNRPGNVISHCVEMTANRDLRTADWFFCKDWVLPWGSQKVAAAQLPSEMTAPDGWAITVEWFRNNREVLQRAQRIVPLAFEILSRRSPIIVIAATAEEGAHWLSLLQWMQGYDIAAPYSVLIGEDWQSFMSLVSPCSRTLVAVDQSVVLGPEVRDLVIDTTAAQQPDSPTAMVWGQILTGLLMSDLETSKKVLSSRDDLLKRYLKEQLSEPFTQLQMLQVAWFGRPNAKFYGQEEMLRALLDEVGPTVRQWPELARLSMQVGSHVDLYADSEDDNDIYRLEDSVEFDYETDSHTVTTAQESAVVTENSDHYEADLGVYEESTGTAEPLAPSTALDQLLADATKLGGLEIFIQDRWLQPDFDPTVDRAALWRVAAHLSWVRPAEEQLRRANERDGNGFTHFVEQILSRTSPDQNKWEGDTTWQ